MISSLKKIYYIYPSPNQLVMTNSTEKINLFQYFSGFLFSSTRDSKHLPPMAEQELSLYGKTFEINFGKRTEKEVAVFFSRWQRLIAIPESFPQDANTPISDFILQKEIHFLINDMNKAVISAHLQDTGEQDNIAETNKSSTKIFHEDYPGSYILAYNKKRLGMFRLSICRRDNGTYEMSYKFDPTILSFKELC